MESSRVGRSQVSYHRGGRSLKHFAGDSHAPADRVATEILDCDVLAHLQVQGTGVLYLRTDKLTSTSTDESGQYHDGNSNICFSYTHRVRDLSSPTSVQTAAAIASAVVK